MDFTRRVRRLPLAGAENMRDLGGYACKDGSTRWGVFLRADCPDRLTGSDLDYLAGYGLVRVADLRREDENIRRPSRFAQDSRFETRAFSMFQPGELVDYEGEVPGSMSGLYRWMLDNSRPMIVHTVRFLLGANGASLFHCAVGKDRTGVIAMLLLDLAGVAAADIVADYCVTDVYKREVFDTQTQVFDRLDISTFVIQSRAESMEWTLSYLHRQYGSAQEYLMGGGFTAEEVAAFRDKFVEAW